jgi:hypothetical protein
MNRLKRSCVALIVTVAIAAGTATAASATGGNDYYESVYRYHYQNLAPNASDVTDYDWPQSAGGFAGWCSAHETNEIDWNAPGRYASIAFINGGGGWQYETRSTGGQLSYALGYDAAQTFRKKLVCVNVSSVTYWANCYRRTAYPTYPASSCSPA